MTIRTMCLAATALLLAACRNPQPAPVPLAGPQTSLDRLTGEWEGSYINLQAGRGGSIVFTLTAGEDHAHGDIVMVPRGSDRPLGPANITNAPDQVAGSEVLTIEFVRVAGDSVSGTVSRYFDPECRCAAHAIFRGRIAGDVISGTFVAEQAVAGGRTSRGTWEVRRTRR